MRPSLPSLLRSPALRESGLILAGTVAYSVLLGWAVDVVTANLAVEYFTVHHPRVVDSQNPWIMAALWGVIATWWAGLIAGTFLAGVNLRLKAPLPAHRVLQMVAWSTLVLWCAMMAIVAGVYFIAELIPEESRRATFESDRRLMAVALGHLSEYLLAAIAALVVAFRMVHVSRRSASSDG